MASVFEHLKETIEQAQQQELPEEARLILWGRIIEAVGRDDITQDEARTLEALLGDMRSKYTEAFDIALFGESKQPAAAA